MLCSTIARAFCALSAVALLVGSSTIARADILSVSDLPEVTFVASPSNGSQGFADLGAPTANTGNINTATLLSFGNMVSNGSQTGYFTGLVTQVLGPVSIDPALGTSISFGNGTFGSFASTSITEQTNTSGERSFLVLGNYSAGTFDPSLTPNPAPASMTISFTQTPPSIGAISASATLAIPPVPEPSTAILAGVGVGGSLLSLQKRRARRPLASGISG